MCQLSEVITLSCYHPLAGIAYPGEYTDKGARKYKIYGSWNPEYKKNPQFLDAIKIPCGHCIGCALDRARTWSDRMILEYVSSGKRAIFVTLTYNNDHVKFGCDENGVVRCFSLCKDDLQRFMKRLRKGFSDREVRFYACGELGTTTKRPHYHIIIFGIGLEDFPDVVQHGINELGQPYFISESFGKYWSEKKKSIGYHILSPVTYKTCNYVARYCMKKIYNSDVVEFGENEFHLMSRRPGLGNFYLKAHPELFDSDKIYVYDGQDQKGLFIPKYFYDRLKVDNPEEYDKLDLDQISVLANDKELLKLQKTSLSYLDMLEVEENEKLDKTKILFKRGEM